MPEQTASVLADASGVACYPRRMPHSGHQRRPAPYEDLLAVPEHLVAEVIGGELHVSARPSPRHADASSGLGGALHGPFDRGHGGPGGWWIPDVWAEMFSILPDWVCAVVSPPTAAFDRVKKLTIYARERFAHAWFAGPIGRTFEVLQLVVDRWTIVCTVARSDVARPERSAPSSRT